MKKTISALILAAAVLVSSFGFGCAGDKVTEINIPAVIVDLSAPENRVEVSASEKSEVFDERGRKLGENEWLLNSKFSKAYIRLLGAGEYKFTYKSAKHTGTITLVVKDEAAPAYVFAAELKENYGFLSSPVLPLLVKEQDSYQEDFEPTYELKKDGEVFDTTATENGFVTGELTDGAYEWKATVIKGGKTYEFKKNFKVGTFEEWLKGRENAFLFDSQTGEYLAAENGVYKVNTENNGDMFSYKADNSVLQIAMKAGKTKFRVEILSDRIIDAGAGNGDAWCSNGWKGYVWAFSGAAEYEEDKLNDVPPRFSGMTITENGYLYYTEGLLIDKYFEQDPEKPLQIDFANGAKTAASISVTFM